MTYFEIYLLSSLAIGMFFLVGPVVGKLRDRVHGRQAKKAFKKVFDGLEPFYNEEDIDKKEKILRKLSILERLSAIALRKYQDFLRSRKTSFVEEVSFDAALHELEKKYHDTTALTHRARKLAYQYGYLGEQT